MNLYDITPKQRDFADLYAIHLNGTRAAILAGYSKNSARVTASKILANVSVQDYLREKRKRVGAKYDLHLERSIERLLDILEPNFCDFVGWDNKNNIWLKPLASIPPQSVAVIKSLRVYKSGAFDLQLHNKTEALKLLSKMIGHFA